MVIDDIVYFGVAPQAVRGGPKSPLAVGECSCGCDRSDRKVHQTHITTMGVDGHGLYRRPWQSTAGSGTSHVLATSWPASGTLVFVFFPGGW